MKSKKKILIVMPAEGKQRSRNLILPSALKKLIPLSIGVLTLLLGFLITKTVHQWQFIKQAEPRATYVSEIEQQLADKNLEITELKNQVETINQNLDTIADRQNEISAMLDYDGLTIATVSPSQNTSGNTSHVGGISTPDDSAPSSDNTTPGGTSSADSSADTNPALSAAYPASSLDEATEQTQIYLSAIESSYGQALIAYENKLQHIPSILPLSGPITSYFGNRTDPFNSKKTEFHNGIDFGTPHGTAVRAPANGKIITAGYEGGWGNLVRIDHGFDITTLYAHLSKVTVSLNQEVKRGDIIGYTGNTGRSTGTHLHYGATLNGQPVDPLRFLPSNQSADTQTNLSA